MNLSGAAVPPPRFSTRTCRLNYLLAGLAVAALFAGRDASAQTLIRPSGALERAAAGTSVGAPLIVGPGSAQLLFPPEDAPDRLPEGGATVPQPEGSPSGRSPTIRGAVGPPNIGGGVWLDHGPGPSLNGQVENISPNDEVSGAIHTVAAHPTDPDILYAGGANGGIWRTDNATAASPLWTPQTDMQTSLSIGALEFDPTDGTHNTRWPALGATAASAGVEEPAPACSEPLTGALRGRPS